MRVLLIVLSVCLSAPLYGEMDGPDCTPERAALACECSECLDWIPIPAATRYEVERETVSTGTRYAVGTVTGRWGETAADWSLPALWCAALDSPFPRAGTLYRYRIRACNEHGCGEWGEPVTYRGADYWCGDGGREVACYVGDGVVSR